MDLLDLFGLLLFAALAWLWLDSLKAREAAVAAAKAACAGEALLLLDDTVAIASVRPSRDDLGHFRVRRTYAFEYTDTGHERRPGSIAMLGSRVLAIDLDLPEVPAQRVLH